MKKKNQPGLNSAGFECPTPGTPNMAESGAGDLWFNTSFLLSYITESLQNQQSACKLILRHKKLCKCMYFITDSLKHFSMAPINMENRLQQKKWVSTCEDPDICDRA